MRAFARNKPECSPNYPKLMRSRKSGVIVLMQSHEVGTVVVEGNNGCKIGDHSTSWDMPLFEDYSGVVELENDK